MAKYDPLRSRLASSGAARLTMSFKDTAALVGGLPKSAWDYPAWWANEKARAHVQAAAWMGAGYRVEGCDQRRGVVTFARA